MTFQKADLLGLLERIDIPGLLASKTPSAWAILLCKFADDTSSPVAMGHYQRLFTGAGSGSRNMVDFFADMSHGQLDLSSSQVFGWFTLPINKDGYAGNVGSPPAGKVNRNGLFDLCKTTATKAGVDLTRFAGVVVSMNGAVDLFGYVGGMAAFCDSLSLQPSLLGQEMGHGYGLDHARRDGSSDDYQDPWDIMSTAAAYMANDVEWQQVGPGLNASAMRGRSWLDESRVWKPVSPGFDATVTLRPLHRHDLSGYLAAELGQFLVELRIKEGWDEAIPRAAVFVHRFEDNHSYVMAGTKGNYDLVEGDTFTLGLETFPYATYAHLEVTNINESARTATVHLVYRIAAPLPHWDLVARVFGGVPVDGGGFIFIGGKVVPVPPRGPAMRLLEQIETYLATEHIEDISARTSAREAILSSVLQETLGRLGELQTIRVPAPREQQPGAGNTGARQG